MAKKDLDEPVTVLAFVCHRDNTSLVMFGSALQVVLVPERCTPEGFAT
jgi:hypothetical protein